MSDSPAVILYDASGNPVVVAEGTAITANHRGVLVAGRNESGDTQFVSVEDDGNIEVTVKKSVAVSIALPPGGLFKEYLLNGTEKNMVVDGSGTPVVYQLDADATDDIYIYEIRILITTDSVISNYSYFIEKPGLSNGCLLELRTESTTYELANFKITEDLFTLPGCAATIMWKAMSVKDALVINYPLPGTKLVHDSGDFVRMTIRDELNDDHIRFGFLVLVIGETRTP